LFYASPRGSFGASPDRKSCGMSFRDLDGGSSKSSGSAAKPQTKLRRDEETSYERSIKANVQEIQDSVRRAGEQLEQSQRSFLSKRISESLERFLQRSRELSQETEQLFRDWTVHLAGEPAERHRKKFSYEKLQKAFEEEVTHLKDVARRFIAAQQEEQSAHRNSGHSGSVECRNVCDDSGFSFCGDSDVEHGLLDDSGTAQDVTIRNRIAQEREEGIRRIQSQVHEVNQIFRDLASIVQEQGHDLETVAGTTQSASSNTKQAVGELKKSVDRQRGSRERLCCMLSAAIVFLFFIILPHLHMSELHYFDLHPSTSGSGSSSRDPPPLTVSQSSGSSSSSNGNAALPPAGWRAAAPGAPSKPSAGSNSGDNAVSLVQRDKQRSVNSEGNASGPEQIPSEASGPQSQNVT